MRYRRYAVTGRSILPRIARKLPSVVLWQPWGLFVKVLCIFSGITAFFGPPGSITQALPPTVVLLWNITLVGGASAGLYGLLRPLPQVEVAGLIWLGTASIVYAVAIIASLGLPGFVAAGIVGAFGLAALVRALAVYVSYEIARRAANP